MALRDTIERMWRDGYAAFAAVFPVGSVPTWDEMDEEAKEAWLMQDQILRDEYIEDNP